MLRIFKFNPILFITQFLLSYLVFLFQDLNIQDFNFDASDIQKIILRFVFMAQRAHQKNTSSKKSSLKNTAETEKQSRFSFLTDGRMKKIVGLLFLLFAAFLAVSLSSYLVTWQNDQDTIFNAGNGIDFLFHNTHDILNQGGHLGAFLSHQLIFNGFGISSFIFVWLFSICGLNLLLPRRIASTLKTIFYTTLFILLLSPVLAYFFSTEKYALSFGGALGEKIITSLHQFAGDIGTLCIMIGLTLITLILAFNPIIHMPLWHRLFAQATPVPSDIEAPVIPINTKKNEGAKLSIEDTIPSVEPAAVEEAQVEEEIIQVPDSFWESETRQEPQVEESHPSNEIQLEAQVDEPAVVSKKTAGTDLTLEVVKKEEEKSEIKDTHVSIASDEPYDPSLELRNYKYPTLDLLDQHSVDEISIDKQELEVNKTQIINTLKSFGIAIAKISATVGPTVTLYEIVPAEGVRISKIRNLEDDIALSLSALGIRIIAPIPGKGTIGIEVPNLKKQIVSMRTLISSDKFINNNFSLPIALGKKIDNENYIVDLATMPHLLMAGATGQGKSVGINAILVSLLYKKHPSQVKFVMVDPKKVELSIYKVIEKHFLAKLPNEEDAIITDTKKVINTLNALCIEMDNRYDLLKEAGVRNIKEYNDKFIKRRLNPNKGHQYLPFIILVVDEFADLIMTAGKEIEMPIARLAQLARAVGIHLIIATQRPSVNVITGTIKANFPARVAYRVSAKVDSRTILDSGGADQLIGRGDMLILNGNDLVRVQCAFVDTPEVERIVNFIGDQQGYPSAFDLPEYEGADGGDLASNSGSKSLKEVDQMFEQCARLVVTSGSGSTSMLQRRFNLGYNRAGRIMDQLEAAGIVGASTGGKPRELMVHTEHELEEILRVICN